MTKTLRYLFIALALVAIPALSHAALILTSVDPGTTPITLGSYTLTAFPLDPQGSLVTSVASPLGGSVTFDLTMDHDNSTGTDWYSFFAVTNQPAAVLLTLPSGTGAFYFYADPFEGTQPVQITASVTSSGASGSISQVISPTGIGTGFFGIYGTAGETITSILVTSPFVAPEFSHSFAVGQFGIAAVTTQPPPGPAPIPEPSSLSLLALGALALGVRRRSRRP